MKRLTLLALAAALAVPAAASAQNHVDVGDHVPAAQDASASILFAAFDPGRNDVLAGDRVTWTNGSVRKHTVTAVDASFNSGQLLGGEQFSHTFGAPGSYAYYCSLHPFMRGEVDVHEVLLARPEAPASPGKPFAVRGRSALTADTPVTVEADSGAGWVTVAQATAGDDGAFTATLKPTAGAQLRAVAAGAASPSVQLLVLDRKVSAVAKTRRGGRVTVRTQVLPASPGATVVLQLRLRERFGWWPAKRVKLDHHSMATFHLTSKRRVRARVVLTLADGATQLAVGPPLRLGGR